MRKLRGLHDVTGNVMCVRNGAGVGEGSKEGEKKVRALRHSGEVIDLGSELPRDGLR